MLKIYAGTKMYIGTLHSKLKVVAVRVENPLITRANFAASLAALDLKLVICHSEEPPKEPQGSFRSSGLILVQI